MNALSVATQGLLHGALAIATQGFIVATSVEEPPVGWGGGGVSLPRRYLDPEMDDQEVILIAKVFLGAMG